MTVETLYALTAIVPAILLALMLIFGIDQDADIDVDVDVDIDVDVDVEADIDSDISTGGGPGFLSIKLILGFITGFGMFGFFAKHYSWHSHHIVTAALGGFMFYYLIYRLVKILYDFQANTQISSTSLIGLEAEVINQIVNNGTGEVKANDPRTNNVIVFRAKAEKPTLSIMKGESVRILSIRGNLAIVRSLKPDIDAKSFIKHSQIESHKDIETK
ncbi:MAG: NfeD family protein [Planctomycetes bacterium]|nr:NfeD family protein [Planctomycetota bacterium]